MLLKIIKCCIVTILVLTDGLMFFLYTRENYYSDANLFCGLWAEIAALQPFQTNTNVRNEWLQFISTMIPDNYSLTLSFLQHI